LQGLIALPLQGGKNGHESSTEFIIPPCKGDSIACPVLLHQDEAKAQFSMERRRGGRNPKNNQNFKVVDLEV